MHDLTYVFSIIIFYLFYCTYSLYVFYYTYSYEERLEGIYKLL